MLDAAPTQQDADRTTTAQQSGLLNDFNKNFEL